MAWPDVSACAQRRRDHGGCRRRLTRDLVAPSRQAPGDVRRPGLGPARWPTSSGRCVVKRGAPTSRSRPELRGHRHGRGKAGTSRGGKRAGEGERRGVPPLRSGDNKNREK